MHLMDWNVYRQQVTAGVGGFPYLSGAGPLVLKDVTLMAGAWLYVADSARAVVAEVRPQRSSTARSLAPVNALLR
jgi:hypothetical protein